MCHGPLVSQIIKFTIPLIISGMLQFGFNAADLIVIGRFSTHEALAAIGATAQLTQFMINVFIGMSIGSNVLVARYLGENNPQEISGSVHTAILTSFWGGLLLAVVGVVTARPLLVLMATPAEILDMATLYMQITFIGMPLVMLYNFGSAVLRAMGDTTRPFYFLVLGGIVNVLLNMFFVIVCGMDVAGVAIATVVSQGLAGVLILRVLINTPGPCQFKWQNLRFSWKHLREMLWIGVPAGFQSSCFSLSNIIVQSSINSFGSAAVAGITASNSLDMICAIGHTAISQSVISFVGQNHGAGKLQRIKGSINICTMMVASWSITLCMLLMIFSEPLMKIFNEDPDVVYFGAKKLYFLMPTFFLCGVMDTLIGALRGLGKSVSPTILTLTIVCLFRVIWIFTVFNPVRRDPGSSVDDAFYALFSCYPLTWLLSAVGAAILLAVELKKLAKAQ